MEALQIKEGSFYQTSLAKKHALIIIQDGKLVNGAIKWAHRNHCHAFVVNETEKTDVSAFGRIISFLHSQGIRKIGLLELGEKTHVALEAAGQFHQITLTIVSNPDDSNARVESIRGFLMCFGAQKDPYISHIQNRCSCVCMPFEYEKAKELIPRSMLPIGYHLGIHGKARQDMDEHMQNIVKIWTNQ